MTNDLESYDSNTHVFVLKIWLEEDNCGRKHAWRGYITHIPSGQRYPLRDLAIFLFVLPYLKKMNLQTNGIWQLKKFLYRLVINNNKNGDKNDKYTF